MAMMAKNIRPHILPLCGGGAYVKGPTKTRSEKLSIFCCIFSSVFKKYEFTCRSSKKRNIFRKFTFYGRHPLMTD